MINVHLNGDLVRQAALHTQDLSRTLERLLDGFVAREQARQDRDAGLDRVVSALNAYHAEHGLLSDDFPGI